MKSGDGNFWVGAPMGIKPASPAFQAIMLTTTLQQPGTKYIKFASSNHPWQMVLLMLLLQCFHTVRVPPILLNRHYSPDQLISTYTFAQALLS